MKPLFNKCIALMPFLALILLMVDLYLIFIFAPEEATQGLAQKIFYFHVSSAFSMYGCFLLAGLGAVLYLWKKNNLYNAISHAGTSAGLMFCAMVLLSGPIWAKPVWGAFWTWDPRLTTTLILFLAFFATLLLRDFYGIDPRGRVYASVMTLFGVLDIPLIIFAVKLWRGIHPSVLGQKNNMPTEMKLTLFFTLFTLFSVMACLIWLKTRHLILKDKLDELTSVMSERTV